MVVSFRKRGVQIISLAPRVVDVEMEGPRRPYLVEHVEARPKFEADAITVEAITREMPSQLDLTDAEVIVAGGKGMKSKENFKLLDELAEILGGTVGATRMAVDLQWQTRDRMVGISGKVVSPEVYFACGISGAIQHVIGMRSSRTIVAINVDPGAPIFRIASLGIIGDVREVLPVMIEACRQRKAEQMTRRGMSAVKSLS
jgi:electron transfer flavoprotein alpha subunit